MMSIRIYSFRMQAPAELCLGVQPRSDGVFALSYVQCFLMNADNRAQGSDRRSADAENQDFQLRTRRRRVPASAMQHISATQHFFDFNKCYLYYAIFDYYYCLFYKY